MIYNWIKKVYQRYWGDDDKDAKTFTDEKRDVQRQLVTKGVLTSNEYENRKYAFHILFSKHYEILEERQEFYLVQSLSPSDAYTKEWRPKEEFLVGELCYSSLDYLFEERQKLLDLIDAKRYNVYSPRLDWRCGRSQNEILEEEFNGIKEFLLNHHTFSNHGLYSNFIIVSY